MIRRSCFSIISGYRNQSICRLSVATNAKSQTGNTKENVSRWQITGFTRYASRLDLLEALGDLKPVKIDPVLDAGYYFQGKYVLTVPEHSSLDTFKKNLNAKFPMKFSVTPIHSFEDVNAIKKLNITNCTVRCKIASPTVITAEELYLLFEGYGLQKNGIHKVINDNSQVNYFIHFLCPEEAERAVTEKENTLLNGAEMRLYWYQC